MCLSGMGRLQAAAATDDAIRRWRPRFILLVGIAGGVAANKVRLGDVLIADQIVDYELQKLTTDHSEMRWEVHRADAKLLNAYINFRDDHWQKTISVQRPGKGLPKLHAGPVASGDKVIASDEVLNRYRDVWSKLVGVEMEAAGAAAVAFQSGKKPGFFMVRGVSDLADKGKNSARVARWRPYACDVAASFAIAFLSSGPVSLSKGSRAKPVQIPENPPDLPASAASQPGSEAKPVQAPVSEPEQYSVKIDGSTGVAIGPGAQAIVHITQYAGQSPLASDRSRDVAGPEAEAELPEVPGSPAARRLYSKALSAKDRLALGIELADQGYPPDLDAWVGLPGVPFELGKYPVTNHQFAKFIEDSGYQNRLYWGANAGQLPRNSSPRFWDDVLFNLPTQPVVGVNWFEANAYCAWLGRKLGCKVRLPTQLEWQSVAVGEKVWRGQELPFYPWGNEFSPWRANTLESDLKRTAPVGCYPMGASRVGAMDMIGNVWEWLGTPGRQPGSYMVLGGSWNEGCSRARLKSPWEALRLFRDRSVGFRVMREV